MVEVIYQKRFLARGPRVVAIGGGTGLSTLLRGLKEHTSNLTAVVTVADDGGSSGVLRDRARDPRGRRHPQLHRRARRRRAAHGPAAPVPLPGHRTRGGLPRSLDRRPGDARVPRPRDAAGRARRARRRQPDPRRPRPARARRLRGGRARDEPRAGRAGSRRAGDGDGASRSTRGSTTAARSWARAGSRRPTASTACGSPPTDVRPTADVARGHRRRRADRPRARQPVHQHPARARRARDPRGDRRVRGAGRVRVQRGDAAGRDRRVTTSRTTSTRSPGTAPATCRTSSSPTTGSTRSAPTGWLGEPVRLQLAAQPAARGPRLVLDDLVDPANAHHHDPERLAAALIGAWEGEGGHRRRPSAARAASADRSA